MAERFGMFAAAIEFVAAALRPADRALHRFALRFFGRSGRHQLVEPHDDVAAEQPLHLDRPLRPTACAVDPSRWLSKETPSSVILVSSLRLITCTAAVGQDRPLPAHEPVQPAELCDPLRAGAQHQMIGIAEDDVRAAARTSSGRIALTVAAVPTGMNAGVRMSPRCIGLCRCGPRRRSRRSRKKNGSLGGA